MKTLSAFVLAALASVPAFAVTLEVDPAHTTAQFAVKHMMVATVRGEFGKVSGRVELDRDNPSRTRVEATIDATTVDTRNTQRDNHLRSADWFDVQRCPTIDFKSTKAEQAGKDRWKVTGDLTMHCITKPVTFDVEGPGEGVKDPGGNLKYGATATAKVNRKDFALNWNQTLDSGGVMVGDQVTITIDAELAEKSQAKAAVKQEAAIEKSPAKK